MLRRFLLSPQQRGFTLLELLVSLAVFAVIGAIAYGGLYSLLNIQAETEQTSAQLTALQRTFLILQRDFNQFIERPIRDEFGMEQAALNGQTSHIEFTHSGWRNPLEQPRSNLQRVAYKLIDQTLERQYWPVLDRAPQTEMRSAALLDNVTALSFRYFDQDLAPQYQWPPPSGADSLRAVEILLDVEGWGRLRRLFVLPDGINPPPILTQ